MYRFVNYYLFISFLRFCKMKSRINYWCNNLWSLLAIQKDKQILTIIKNLNLCFRLFGGALAKVEGRARLQPSWALLLTDLLVFARVSRDRVLFVTEEPLRLSSIAEACFTVRKRPTEFRLQVAIHPNGSVDNDHAETINSGGCSPHSRPRRRVLILRAPTPELKAVWHNLLQRQMWVAGLARKYACAPRGIFCRESRYKRKIARMNQVKFMSTNFHCILASMWIQAVVWVRRIRTVPKRVRLLVTISP